MSDTPGSGWGRRFLFGGALLLLVGLAQRFMSDEPSGIAADVLARQACERAVLSELRSPGTAVFGDWLVGGSDTLTLSGHVDSQNAFGGEVRTDVSCVAMPSGTGFEAEAILLPR